MLGDNSKVQWLLTTQRFYVGNNRYPLQDFIHMTRMDSCLYCDFFDDTERARHIYSYSDISENQLNQIAELVNRTIHAYLVESLPSSLERLMSLEYYYWNKIFILMDSYSRSFKSDDIYDGTKLTTFKKPEHKEIRNFAGTTSYIFKYIRTRYNSNMYGMGVNHDGLNISVEGKSDKIMSAFYPWKDLASTDISAYEKWSGAFLVIGNTTYPLGATGASTDKWCEYIKNMVMLYSSAMQEYDEYVEEFSTKFDGFVFDSIAEKQYVKRTIHNEILNIQAKYPGLRDNAYTDKDYFLGSLNLPFINDIITFLENVSTDSDKTKVLEYVEAKKKFYLPLREMMIKLADQKSIDDALLKIQAKYPDIVDNAYSNRSYFLSSLNFKFIDEIIAYLQGISVKPENTTLIEYVESKKSFYLPLRKEMEFAADKKALLDGLQNIQAKYNTMGSAYFDRNYFLDSLNFPFIDDLIAYLEGIEIAPHKEELIEFVESKKNFYLLLRKEMEAAADIKSVDDEFLKIQAKYSDIKHNVCSNRSYFLSSLNLKFIDELIAYLEGVTVEPEKNKLREYIEEKKQFYISLRTEMQVLADKKFIDDGLLKIQANYSTVTYNVLSDRNYFIENRNLPFINAIITFLEGVTAKPEQSKLLEYIKEKKNFYLPIQKEVKELCAEFKEIEEITKGRYYSTNAAELKSWNDALSKKEFHTTKAKEIVENIQLLASYSQKDLDFFVLIASMLPKGNGITTIDENNFVRIQKEFMSRVKDNEIVLSYTRTGLGVDSWMLTTQRLYVATVGYNLADILAIICIDNYLLVIAQPENKYQAKRTYLIHFDFDKMQLLNIVYSLSSICYKYLEKNLPESGSKFLTYEYYFYNGIIPKLIDRSRSYVLKNVHDGTNTPIESPIREVSGRDTFIFRYITSTSAGNKGMALTDQGLFITQPNDSEKTFLKWEQLVNADISVKKKGFFSKDEMIMNGQTYSLGKSDAKTEDWVYYLNQMIETYKECIRNYPSFIHKIQSLPNFPPLKDTPSLQHIIYIPPQPVPTPSGSASTVTDTPSTPDNKKETKSSMFSSFKSSIMSSSKSALDKAADIGAKTSSSFAASFINKTKSAFGIGKDSDTKNTENTLENTEELEPVSSSKSVGGDRVCPNCGASMAKDQLFCGKCGTKYVDIQNMKLCPTCGAEVEDGMKFCRMCGAKLNVNQPKFCPNCGSKLAEGTKFCGNCGNKV